MAFIMELGGKSSGHRTLLQAGSSNNPRKPPCHCQWFFLQWGWLALTFILRSDSHWLQGKTCLDHDPFEKGKKKNIHLATWIHSRQITSHRNHERGKKCQVQCKIFQDAHLLALLDLWDGEEMLCESQKYHNSYCWDCDLWEGISVNNNEP